MLNPSRGIDEGPEVRRRSNTAMLLKDAPAPKTFLKESSRGSELGLINCRST